MVLEWDIYGIWYVAVGLIVAVTVGTNSSRNINYPITLTFALMSLWPLFVTAALIIVVVKLLRQKNS